MTHWMPAVAVWVFVISPLRAQSVDFNRDIRPILSDKCFTCHGPDATHRQAKLRFDIPSAIPGNEVLRRIASPNAAERMPPAYAGKAALTAAEIERIRRWIAGGARYEGFWSFVPPRRPETPAGVNAIDYFIRARLEREGLRPSPEADRATLIRRVSMDLTGVPPTPAETAAFVQDASPRAYEALVDRLLASPRYGERMAFRWMEAARYGDTNGYQTDGPRDMWRWRDWVIESFNRNVPFDRFTIQQVAGDLLPDATLEDRIATGFLRNHRTSGEGGIIPEEYRVEYVADRAQTTSTVFLGLTMGCARCHDHKYDPLSQKEFYQLFAYFNRVPDEKGFVWNYGNEEPLVKAPLPEQAQKLASLDAQVEAARQAVEGLQPRLREAQRQWERGAKAELETGWVPGEGLVFRQATAGLNTEALKVGGCEAAGAPCTWSGGRFDGVHFLETDGKAADFDYLQPFTFAAWIDAETPNGAIVSHAEDFFEGMGHGLYLVDGKLRVHILRRWTDLGIRVESAEAIPLHRREHVMVTYDGERKAAGVHLYLDGRPLAVKVLFDQNTEPIHLPKAPLRVGAGAGLRFRGAIEEAMVFNRALNSTEAAALAVADDVAAIVALPEGRRTAAQAAKVAAFYLERAAPAELRAPIAELAKLRAERKQFHDKIPSVMVMAEAATPRDTFVLKRGAYDNPGEKVTAGVPAMLPQPRAEWPNNRLGLARWLVDGANPLTARVTVNRFWQSYFGYGIVKTVDDFGAQGEFPVHPELLDWLATEFVASGWDVKALQKTIVMSATYRQESRASAELLQKDPDNRLLARGPRFRLGPEMIRDQALAAAGLLVEKVGGPSVKPYQPAGLWQELGGGSGYKQDQGEGLYRRSLYTYWKRTVAPPFMVNFDSPNREQCTVFENRTNSPLQALDLMNDVTFLEAARKVGERMLLEGGSETRARLSYGYRLVLAREPQAAQVQILERALERFRASFARDAGAAAEYLKQGDSPVRAGLDAAELAAYASVGSLLLNLDEAVTKQ